MSAVPIVAAYLVRKRQEEKARKKSENEPQKNHINKVRVSKSVEVLRSPILGEYALKLSKKHPGKVTWIDIAVLLGLILAGLATIWGIYAVIHDTF
ncbi:MULTISPECIES: hypothetical protein [Streptococcus]|uniref:Preprotein translocase subunit SecE n=1 Tax=Streptococcus equi subsp. zooepidemicus TaxID=40041 RepID=A0AAX2LHR1_STRSZ|nr:hypothetical protein [Streptococcus equi]MCD3397131.1 hypothetical protein [Streptococcus equi subsp. zooepidemicus]MCD3427210.1 hypothetical protein [Streptococcus equi subsp. zooepidemicus]MCD3436091.1 hypothetical protein [Streptococcus equi subsp. zooepidemicus]MCD3439369.1 hypothetical protein [Streptococcus equi subsp. zooepidemicus]MCD3464487.1 hypothetical protein [Streptococcus equi subsp. zooepidemicus]